MKLRRRDWLPAASKLDALADVTPRSDKRDHQLTHCSRNKRDQQTNGFSCLGFKRQGAINHACLVAAEQGLTESISMKGSDSSMAISVSRGHENMFGGVHSPGNYSQHAVSSNVEQCAIRERLPV
jgi:hypothetical protein